MSSIRHYTCYILSNALFAAGTTFLLVSTRNESTRQAVQRAGADSDECVRLMLDFPTSASRVGSEILNRLCTEWKTPEQPLQIRASNKDEAVRLLNDSNSDMVKLLTELGWQPPAINSPLTYPVVPDLSTSVPNPFGTDYIFNPVGNSTNIENYDRTYFPCDTFDVLTDITALGLPAWFLNDLTETGNWPT